MNDIDLYRRLINKSTEAFSLAIELYNKPTIRYRVEGFALFICNSWELMLKAHLLKTKGSTSIYYKDNSNRTISLENCIRDVFTNKKDPLRINLEKIIELRNTSTHFITEEYEMVYVPLFQACVLNYNEKIMTFHKVDITKIIPQNFLTLSVSMKALDESEIVAKYPEEIATKLVDTKLALEEISMNNNAKFAIRIEHHHYLTKDKEKATSFVKVDKESEVPVKIIKELKDPNNTHKYTLKACTEKVRENLHRQGITLIYNNRETKFNSFHFLNFCKYYNLKDDERFCYIHRQYKSPQYTYSQQTIDFILDEIAKDAENILNNIAKK